MKAQLPSNDQEETCRILDHSQSSITPGLGNIADVSRLPGIFTGSLSNNRSKGACPWDGMDFSKIPQGSFAFLLCFVCDLAAACIRKPGTSPGHATPGLVARTQPRLDMEEIAAACRKDGGRIRQCSS